MKVHNYGNDYAYQQAQSKTREAVVEQPSVNEPETKEAENAVYTVQNGGESPVADAETASESSEESKPTTSNRKKKKQD